MVKSVLSTDQHPQASHALSKSASAHVESDAQSLSQRAHMGQMVAQAEQEKAVVVVEVEVVEVVVEACLSPSAPWSRITGCIRWPPSPSQYQGWPHSTCDG